MVDLKENLQPFSIEVWMAMKWYARMLSVFKVIVARLLAYKNVYICNFFTFL